MISGLYMAMILTEKYTGAGAYRKFLINRALRIYPVYWVIAAATLLVWYALGGIHQGPLGAFLAPIGSVTRAFTSAANLLIFGQDAVMFFYIDSGHHLHFTANFWDTNPQLWRFLLIPPAWSLAVELMFYLIAPVLVRLRGGMLLALITASLGLRALFALRFGLDRDPWSYRFFPFELAFFLAGILGYRAYARFFRTGSWRQTVTCAAFFLLILKFRSLPMGEWIMYAAAAATIPMLFGLTRQFGMDRRVGELSYPLYLVHGLIYLMLQCAVPERFPAWGLTVAVLAMSLGVSAALVKLVVNPIEKIRQRRAGNVHQLLTNLPSTPIGQIKQWLPDRWKWRNSAA
jgi:peptidoglycan/LPS O-acetylase OafA/YrhL